MRGTQLRHEYLVDEVHYDEGHGTQHDGPSHGHYFGEARQTVLFLWERI